MKTSEKIIAYIKEKGEASINELTGYLGISRVAVSKQLNNLMAEDRVAKAR